MLYSLKQSKCPLGFWRPDCRNPSHSPFIFPLLRSLGQLLTLAHDLGPSKIIWNTVIGENPLMSISWALVNSCQNQSSATHFKVWDRFIYTCTLETHIYIYIYIFTGKVSKTHIELVTVVFPYMRLAITSKVEGMCICSLVVLPPAVL